MLQDVRRALDPRRALLVFPACRRDGMRALARLLLLLVVVNMVVMVVVVRMG